jgi:hypothetical protein
MGLPCFCPCSDGFSGCEGGGWGADMVLEKRDVWRDAHAVPGARKPRTGYWMLRGIPRPMDGGGRKEDGMLSV